MRNTHSVIKFFILMLAIIITGCSSNVVESEEDNANEITETDVLKIAIDAQPPTLDQPISTSAATRDTSRLMFETLITTDSNYQIQPMLAESIDTEDNKTFTFHLRKGIKFHNGKEMTAEDVVASMYRWMESSTVTGNIFNGATFEAKDDYTVVLQLQQASVLALDVMASAKQAAAIMPIEVIEEAPTEGVSQYIGTGPYKFVEWRQDQYIHFNKYEDYQPLETPADGLAGRKEAMVDDIYFYIVPDASTRLTGLQTGEYDIAYGIPADDYEQLNNDPNLETYVYTYGQSLLVYNKIEGLASDFRIREAINMALNAEDIMLAAYINDDLYDLEPGYMDKSVKHWASDAGSEYYNQNDPEKAKELLDKAGYTGEEFVILTTRDYDSSYNATVVIQEQLAEIGLNVQLEVYDFATYQERREDPDLWDVFYTSSSIVSTPSQLLSLSPTWAGGVADEKTMNLLSSIETAPTQEEAKQLWNELQKYCWEEYLPVTVLGSDGRIIGANKKVKGLTITDGGIFWNTYLEK